MRTRLLTLLLTAGVAVAGLSGVAIAEPQISDTTKGGGFSYDASSDYNKAVVALKAGQFQDADRLLNNVLSAMPDDAGVLMLSGYAKAGMNDFRGAERAYQRSLRADGKNVDARRELALLRAKQGDAKGAGDELKALRSRLTSCKDTCAEADRIKAAVAAVESALAAKPSA